MVDGCEGPLVDGGENPLADGGEDPLVDGGEGPLADGGEGPLAEAGADSLAGSPFSEKRIFRAGLFWRAQYMTLAVNVSIIFWFTCYKSQTNTK